MTVEIGADRRLVVDLPDEIPVGPVNVVITANPATVTVNASHAVRDAARAKLQAAGVLSTVHHAPANSEPLSAGERARVWQQFSQGRTSDDLIDELRGSR